MGKLEVECTMPTETAAAKTNLGILYVIFAVWTFAFMAVLVKKVQTSTGAPLLQMQGCRLFVQWCYALANFGVLHAVAYYQPKSRLVTELKQIVLFGEPAERGMLLFRASLYWFFLFCWWTGLRYLPVGDATSLVYMYPVLTALLSWAFK